MLERIAEIRGVGLLYQANGKPHTFQKATLIYADNGRGKSTLATVLRSVSNGDVSLIADRKTVDGTAAPKVVLHFNSGHKVSFDAGAWSEQRPEVLVFGLQMTGLVAGIAASGCAGGVPVPYGRVSVLRQEIPRLAGACTTRGLNGAGVLPLPSHTSHCVAGCGSAAR